jgi:hypothetical protein
MLTTEKLTLTQNRLTWGVNINTVLMLIDFVLMLTLLCAAVFFERLHTEGERGKGKGERGKGKGERAETIKEGQRIPFNVI